MKLTGKTALISGGGTGIGQAIAQMFAKEGADVIVCGRRKEPLEKTVELITSQGGKASYQVCDISSSEHVLTMIETIHHSHPSIDILVNNAGIYKAKDVTTVEESEWDSVLATDLKGVFLLSKAVLPDMLSHHKGKIIHIASIAGLIGFEQSAAYCAAKGAVINLTRQMALDYASQGIGVNAIAPGVIESDMTTPLLSNEETKKSFLEKIPAQRIGQPEDIAAAATFLASDESNYIHGHTLVVDGGWMIR